MYSAYFIVLCSSMCRKITFIVAVYSVFQDRRVIASGAMVEENPPLANPFMDTLDAGVTGNVEDVQAENEPEHTHGQLLAKEHDERVLDPFYR